MVWSENNPDKKFDYYLVKDHLPQNGASTHITFTNRTGQEVTVSWVNFEQQETFYASLGPNESYQQ
jgi:hypothetical protein